MNANGTLRAAECRFFIVEKSADMRYNKLINYAGVTGSSRQDRICGYEKWGFAMIHPYSNLGETPDYVLAEFTIFPMYRRKHLAKTAAEMIFDQFEGCWEVKYNKKNTAAKKLWNNVTGKYCPKVIHLNDTETVLSFCST